MNKTVIKNAALRARGRLSACAGEQAYALFIREAARRCLEANGLPSNDGLAACFGTPVETDADLFDGIPPEDWKEPEILGWLYQYFFSEEHEEVVDPLHGKTVRKEDVPAATQLFTTEWVVRYILDNSLGRYWLERHPESKLAEKLTFLVTPKDGGLPTVNESVLPEDLKVFDPCVGAGHFLSYAFDVLLEIYRECGRSDKDAARSIVENNLYGADIDERVVRIARFTVLVKARRYDNNISANGLQLLALRESGDITDKLIKSIAGNDKQTNKDLETLRSLFDNAREYGSMISVPELGFKALYQKIEQGKAEVKDKLLPLVRQAEMLAGKYQVVVTNPPYLNKYSPKLKEFINRHYKPYKGDLFSVFIYRDFGFCQNGGYCGYMTPMVWMFIRSYERLRRTIIGEKNITTLIQFEYSAYEDATVPLCAFVLKNGQGESGAYFKLSDFRGGMEVQREKVLEALDHRDCGYYFEADQSRFSAIPGAPVAFWLSDAMLNAFAKGALLGKLADARQGMATADNERFVRLWHEVAFDRTELHAADARAAMGSGKKWFPYNKGGDFRKWYGNDAYLVNWERDGAELKAFPRAVLRNRDYYFKPCVSWSLVSSGAAAFRYKEPGQLFDVAGMSLFSQNDLWYLIALCNTRVVLEILKVLAPTVNFQCGDIANIPVLLDEKTKPKVEELARDCVALSKADWDAFENARDFRRHPLAPQKRKDKSMAVRIADRYKAWENEAQARFDQLRANEEELNRIFIDIYGLQDELTPAVEDRDVTVRKADLRREVNSLISYAVGCVFGRYSPDAEGLCYAGGAWDDAPYKTVVPVRDNVLLLDGDGEDDATERFVDFVKKVYGEETLEENLRFVADALGGKGAPRDVIRAYLRGPFYADHLRVYQKRPIYWLFSSGKKGAFQALVYMHRYTPELLDRLCVLVRERRARLDAGDPEREAELRSYEEKLRRLAARRIELDLDDGVKANYAKLQDVLEKID